MPQKTHMSKFKGCENSAEGSEKFSNLNKMKPNSCFNKYCVHTLIR